MLRTHVQGIIGLEVVCVTPKVLSGPCHFYQLLCLQCFTHLTNLQDWLCEGEGTVGLPFKRAIVRVIKINMHVEVISILVIKQMGKGLISRERQGDKSYYLGPLFLASGSPLRSCIPTLHPGPHESKRKRLGRPQGTALKCPKWDSIFEVCTHWNRGLCEVKTGA